MDLSGVRDHSICERDRLSVAGSDSAAQWLGREFEGLSNFQVAGQGHSSAFVIRDMFQFVSVEVLLYNIVQLPDGLAIDDVTGLWLNLFFVKANA